MANYSLAGDCCSGEDPASSSSSSAPATFPSFWPPFPSFLSDSDSDAPFATAAQQDPAAAFLGLDFYHDEDGAVVWAAPDEAGLPLCWDCLQLEEHEEAHHQRWDAEEWEQVATGRDEAAAVRSLEWEVLLAANSLGSLLLDDDDGAGVDTYFLDDAEDALFGQLAADAEHEPPAKGGRAAARAAVEALPTVADAAAQCAVCKDGIEAGEAARRLPCAHLYHGACILPWLAIRNTCPLCRHELPTDDAEYETWKARRDAGDDDDDRAPHRLNVAGVHEQEARGGVSVAWEQGDASKKKGWVKQETFVLNDYDEEAAIAAAMEQSRTEEEAKWSWTGLDEVLQLPAMVADHIASLPPPLLLPPHAPPQAEWDGQTVPPPPQYQPPPTPPYWARTCPASSAPSRRASVPAPAPATSAPTPPLPGELRRATPPRHGDLRPGAPRPRSARVDLRPGESRSRPRRPPPPLVRARLWPTQPVPPHRLVRVAAAGDVYGCFYSCRQCWASKSRGL
ncbi:hypothetical protein QYE76_027025 [Lolium multiflorum]|uniref:RING-type domain-containing protein n=1 Tax=Lolium multiflorum TaxID=4521 RepID=A0AAD8QKB3_LOLMU|nr:hypothetical protein QYE76_027025 [Lolium multiflorum]